jgi:16S rRNA (cytidine1402-2'-O)-methyltransferase
MKGKVYLIPSPISEETADMVIPQVTRLAIASLTYFLAEDVRTARRYIASLRLFSSVEDLRFVKIKDEMTAEEWNEIFGPVIHEGVSTGILSEAGCPGIADPGAAAVAYAHQHELEVIPLVGPSSIILAMMGSGLNGQSFCFHGYLPIGESEAMLRIRQIEKESLQRGTAHVFIETPYRNQRIFALLLRTLRPDTRLSIAVDITGARQTIRTRTVKEWKRQSVSWPRLPAIFLIQA